MLDAMRSSVVLGLLTASLALAEQPTEPNVVLPRTADEKYLQNEQDLRVRLSRMNYAVLAEMDGKLRIRQDGVEGWVRREDFVPLGQALDFFTKVLAEKPSDLHALNARAVVHELSGRPKDAVGDYTEAIRLSPSTAHFYNNRAKCWELLNRPEKVLEDYTKAIELDPTDTFARTNRGQLYHRLDKNTEALTDLNEAIRLEPRNPHALTMRGFVHLALDKRDAALADANEAVRLDAKSADAYRLRSVVQVHNGRWGEAIADARRSADLSPSVPEALVLLAVLLAEAPDEKLRNIQEAATLARRACVLSKHRNSLCLQALATACAANGDFDEAVRWQTKALNTPDGRLPIKQAEQRLEHYKRKAGM